MTSNFETISQKIQRRQVFLNDCSNPTRLIHDPIIDVQNIDGKLNPAGLGDAHKFSETIGVGQSAVAFETLAAYRTADAEKKCYSGGAEYGVPGGAEAAAVCRKMAGLHDGAGAIICPSGLSAITTTLEAFGPTAIAIPENVYGPLVRFVEEVNKKKNRIPIKLFRYSSTADAAEVKALLENTRAAGTPIDMIYLEAPSSKTLEIPDIAGIARLANDEGILSVIDSSGAPHVRFKPLNLGIRVVVLSTTKYEGGWYDTISGFAIAHKPEDLKTLQDYLRATGNGAVAPQTCNRVFHRVDSMQERLDQHYDTALKLMAWFQEQLFVAAILCPALKSSPSHERFKQYFG